MTQERLDAPEDRAFRPSLVLSAEESETLDWDAQITSAPARLSRTVVVRFVQGDCRPPRIVDDPEC